MEKKEVIKLLGQKYSTIVYRRAANDKHDKFAGIISTDKIKIKKALIGLFRYDYKSKFDYDEVKVPLKDITGENIFKYHQKWETDKKKVEEKRYCMMKELNTLQHEARADGFKPFGVIFS